MKKRFDIKKIKIFKLIIIFGGIGLFLFVAACTPLNPDDRVLCPTPYVTKTGGKIKSGKGMLEITHISGQCQLNKKEQLRITGRIMVKSTGKTDPAIVYLTLTNAKGKHPTYRQVYQVKASKSAKTLKHDFTVTYQLQEIEDYPYSYGLFVGFVGSVTKPKS